MCEACYYMKDWSEWDKEDLVYHAKELLETWLENRPKHEGWVVDVDSQNRLYAYNYMLVVATEPVFIPHPTRLADEVHYRMSKLDPLLTY